MSLMGIDIGTSGCKAGVFSCDGTLMGYAYRAYAMRPSTEGYAELDPAEVWRMVCEVIRESNGAATQAGGDPLTALCVSSMGEAVTPLDADENALGPTMLSCDSRGGAELARLAAQCDPAAWYAINPNILSPNYTLPKILWLRTHRPELAARVKRYMLWDGLAALWLGAEAFVSHSGANRTLLFDLDREDWSDELLDLSDIRRSQLPRCLAAGTVAGTVRGVLARELGLPDGVHIVVGSHDQCCNALGAGIHAPGRAVDGIGTYECITPVYRGIPDRDAMRRLGLNVEHHVVKGLYASFLFNQAGSLVRWFGGTFMPDVGESFLPIIESEIPSEPTELAVLPYFEPTGSPGYVNDAAGVILGLTTRTRRGEIFRAILESTTFYFLESLSALAELAVDASEFVVTGGGAKSDAWLQIKADIYGVPVVRLATTECGLCGAAMLAGVSTGALDSFDAASRAFVRRGRVFEPDAHHHARYAERANVYRHLFPALHPHLRDWRSAVSPA